MADQLGKINFQGYEDLLSGRFGAFRKEVKLGPAFGVDVSITSLPGGMALAATSDPLSLIRSLGLQESAWLSVHLMTNDMATTGFAPQYGQFVLNLPDTLSKNEFSRYWGYIDQYCKEIGLAITGGHTGFINGQNSTFAGGGTLMTIAPESEMICANRAQVGDAILMTKTSGLTATAILGMSFPETIIQKLGKEVYHSSCEQFYHTSSLQDALCSAGIETKFSEIHAMHDVTEGGVLGAIYEMAIASEKGALIYNELIPVGQTAAVIAELFGLDPRYCIGAGSMIIACDSERVELVIKRLAKEGILCTEVGKIMEPEFGVLIQKNGIETTLTHQEKDPYWGAYFNAVNKGWK